MNPDFRDMLSAFCAESVEFLIVAAYVLAAHGLPRATGDIDLWVRPSPENAQKVWKALQSFRAPLKDLRIEDLHSPDIVFQIGTAPTDVSTS